MFYYLDSNFLYILIIFLQSVWFSNRFYTFVYIVFNCCFTVGKQRTFQVSMYIQPYTPTFLVYKSSKQNQSPFT